MESMKVKTEVRRTEVARSLSRIWRHFMQINSMIPVGRKLTL